MSYPAVMSPVRLIEDSVVWDNHVCIGSRVGSSWVDELHRAHLAGFSFVSVNVGDGKLELDKVIRLLADFRDWVHRHHGQFMLASTAHDVHRAKQQGKTAIAFDLEGVYSLSGQINLVPLLFELGVRWMLFAYNRKNWAAGGCHDEGEVGLTTEGIALVKEMDRVGMVKCCSHTNDRAAWEVFEHSQRPTVFSHSNARAVHEHPRNIPDELVHACAASGGVVGVNGLNIFLGEAEDLPTLLVRHIDHLVQQVGPQHVGLGLDYVLDLDDLNNALEASQDTWPAGYGYGRDIRFVQPEQLPQIVQGMIDLGYSREAIQSILGGNFLRVAAEVWGS